MSIQDGMSQPHTTDIIHHIGAWAFLVYYHPFYFLLSKERTGGGSRVFDIYLGELWIVWIMTFWYLTVFYHSLQFNSGGGLT